MLAVLMAIGLLPPPAGPLDGFEANLAAVHVEIEYSYTAGRAESSALDVDQIWAGRGVNFKEDPALTVLGRWDHDGAAERYVCRSLPEVLEHSRQTAQVGDNPHVVQPFELVFDGRVAAHHFLKADGGSARYNVVSVRLTDDPVLLDGTGGPLCWWMSNRFPRIIRAGFANVQPRRSSGLVGGRPTEVERYVKPLQDGRPNVLEISYDPSIGYLPRHARSYAATESGTGIVREMYLTEAQACAAGGFVPTEWYEVFFTVDEFARRYPDPDSGTSFETTSAEVHVGHYRMISIRDRTAPVRLLDLEHVRWLSSPGGRKPLPKGTRSLSINDLRGLLGDLLTNPKRPVMPTLDVAERNEFSRPQQKWARWPYWLALGIAISALVGVIVWRRGAVLLVAIVCGGSLCGCARSGEPIARLSAAFQQAVLVHDVGKGAIPMTLIVRNDGNQSLRLFRVDAGCSCRQADQSRFPTTLKPGTTLAIAVQMAERRSYEPQRLRFTFETDHGEMVAPVTLLALPRHHVSPDSVVHNAVNEDERLEFDLVHREIHEAREAGGGCGLQVPPGFTVTKADVKVGHVNAAPDYRYRDTAYRVTVEDQALGLYKSAISLRESDGRALIEVPITWTRRGFLSTVPERIVLGRKPVRVFLRCPDETVELTKILSSPGGIKAAVSSTREATVMLGDDAPPIIQGVVEIGTTATDRPTLRVPVVRYAPIASN